MHKAVLIENKEKSLEETGIKNNDSVTISQIIEADPEDEFVEEQRLPILTKPGYKCFPSIAALY